METITHRELRNQSGEILRRVEAGESFQVTNNGRPAAMIVPIGGSEIDALIARGEARAARTDLRTALAAIKRSPSSMSTQEIIEDLRGRW